LTRIIGAKREAPRMPIRTGASLSAMGGMLAADPGRSDRRTPLPQ
jgi:hypothetical protein